MVNRIVLNTVSYHGSGAVKEIGPELSARGFRKALICSGKHVVKSGEINKILDPLERSGHRCRSFHRHQGQPHH